MAHDYRNNSRDARLWKRRLRGFAIEEIDMQKYQTAAAILGSLLFAGVISAQGSPSFESLDKNADGQISIQEATGHDDLFVAFKKLDTNKDGMLSKEEFAAYSKK
jgi:hypothetical protein